MWTLTMNLQLGPASWPTRFHFFPRHDPMRAAHPVRELLLPVRVLLFPQRKSSAAAVLVFVSERT